jgi:hypothetical protein
MKHKWLIVLIIIVLGFYGFSAWSQYTWHDRFIAQTGSDWVVFDEQKNAADILFPYTFFIPPANRLGLIQSRSVKKINDGVYRYKIMWADGPVGNSMPTEESLTFADCNKKLSGSLPNEIKTFDNISQIQWKRPDDNPYVANSSDKEKLMRTFEKQCEILTK